MKNVLKRKILLSFVSLIFTIYSLSLLFPFFWMLYNSLKTNSEFFMDVFSLPKRLNFENYMMALRTQVEDYNIVMMFLNTTFISIIGTIINVFASAIPAYVLAKYKFKGSNFIFNTAIIIMLIPTVGSLSATFRFMTMTNLYNTYFGVFLLYGGSFGFGFILLYGFFKSISWSYAEAAFADGAGHFAVFFKIMIPQAVSALFAVGLLQFIGLWNDFYTPYLFLPSKPTLAVGLQSLVKSTEGGSEWPTLFAIMILSIIPVITIFIAFQKNIMENTISGGLKG